jgi:hypothetical protein
VRRVSATCPRAASSRLTSASAFLRMAAASAWALAAASRAVVASWRAASASCFAPAVSASAACLSSAAVRAAVSDAVARSRAWRASAADSSARTEEGRHLRLQRRHALDHPVAHEAHAGESEDEEQEKGDQAPAGTPHRLSRVVFPEGKARHLDSFRYRRTDHIRAIPARTKVRGPGGCGAGHTPAPGPGGYIFGMKCPSASRLPPQSLPWSSASSRYRSSPLPVRRIRPPSRPCEPTCRRSFRGASSPPATRCRSLRTRRRSASTDASRSRSRFSSRRPGSRSTRSIWS